MTNTLIASLVAATLALPLPALAQSAPAAGGLDTMQPGPAMLETSMGNQLRRFGIDIGSQPLTIGQLAQLHGILSGSEEGNLDGRVRAVIAN